jgi:hypothetical protein
MRIELFSLKCIDILPDFKVRHLRIQSPKERILYASHKNLHRTDWVRGHTIPHPIKCCGFKFSNFQIKLNQPYSIEYTDKNDDWHHLLKFRFISRRGRIELNYDESFSKITDLLDGFHSSHLSISLANKWTHSNKFTFSGWGFLREDKLIEQFRIVYQNGHIIPLLSTASPLDLNNYFNSIDRFSFCGFTTASAISTLPAGNASIQAYVNLFGGDKSWHDLLCIKIDHKIFGRFVRVQVI